MIGTVLSEVHQDQQDSTEIVLKTGRITENAQSTRCSHWTLWLKLCILGWVNLNSCLSSDQLHWAFNTHLLCYPWVCKQMKLCIKLHGLSIIKPSPCISFRQMHYFTRQILRLSILYKSLDLQVWSYAIWYVCCCCCYCLTINLFIFLLLNLLLLLSMYMYNLIIYIFYVSWVL